MKKNLKVLSSLALAGMLTTGVMGTSSAAITTKDVTSTVPGIYSNTLVSSIKNVVPIMLDNAKDIATMKDIIESGLFDKTAFQGFDENKQFRSGDTFKLKGKEYTVLVMGDADRNGIVDINDALEIAKYKRNVAGNKVEGNEIALASGDVRRAAGQGADINDALRIQQFVLGQLKTKGENIVDKLPDADVVEEYPYTLTVEGGYINNQNAGSGKTATVNIELTPSDTQITGLKIKVLDSEGKEVPASVTNGISSTTIAAHLALLPVTGFDFSNVTNTPDGTYTIQLLDKDDTVVGETTVEKNIQTPTAAKVVAKRLNTKDATVSLEGYGTEIKKVYYVINTSATATVTINDQTKYLEVDGNKLVDAPLDKELENNQAYVLEYVLENVYGSRSGVLSTTITKDGNSVKQEKPVTNINVPTLQGSGNNAFTWTADADQTVAATYTVTLYKDGEIVYENNNVPAYSGSARTASIDFTAVTENGNSINKMAEAGRYKIGVMVNADSTNGSMAASEEVVSGEVEVKQLQEVSKIDFTIPEDTTTLNKRMLSWEDSNAKNDVDGYTINLYKYDETTKKYDTNTIVATATTDADTKEIDLTDHNIVAELAGSAAFTFDKNTMYQAEVIVKAKANQKAVMPSKGKLSEGFYEVNVAGVTTKNATDTSVTLGDVSGIKVSGITPTFKVKVYVPESTTDDLSTVVTKYNYLTTKDATVTEDGKNIIVNGLTNNTAYKFKLVADINGTQGESAPISGTTLPVIDGLRKVEEADAKEAGTIFYDSTAPTKAYIDGKEITLANYGTAKTTLTNILNIVDKIHVNDTIKVSEDTITIDTSATKAEDDSKAINFAAAATGKKVVLIGNTKNLRKVATTGKAKEVTLSGNQAMFDITGLMADKIVVENGVDITCTAATAKTKFLTIDANATVTINGIKIKTEKQATIAIGATDTTLNVQLEQGTVTTNNLTFTNNEGKNAVIGFVKSNGGNPASYVGEITIDSKGGTVTVSAVPSTVNVKDVELKVTAEDSTKVDVSGAYPADNKKVSVTVTEDASDVTDPSTGTVTVDAIAEKAVPSAVSTLLQVPTAIELKEYTDDEIKTTFSVSAENDIKAIREFINSFGLNGKGAYLTNIATTKLTITFVKAGTFTVEGIK